MPLGLEIGAKEILISRDEKGYGLHVHGQSPVTIRNVAKEGPAYKAGARIGDQIIKVNGEYVGEASHEKVVRMIKDQKFVRLLVRPCPECPGSPSSSEASLPPAVPARHRSNASAAAAASAAVRLDDAGGAALPKLPARSVSDGLLKQLAAADQDPTVAASGSAGGSGVGGGKSANEIKRRSTTPSSSCDAETTEYKSVQRHGEDIMKNMTVEAYQNVLTAIKSGSLGGSGDHLHQQTSPASAPDWPEVEKSFACLRALLDKYCPRPAGTCPVETALDFANSARLPPLPQAAVAALKASPKICGPAVVAGLAPTRIDLHFEPGMSTDALGSPASTPRSPLMPPQSDDDSASGIDRMKGVRARQEPQPSSSRDASPAVADDDDDEPDIDVSSFMSFDPNFNRETPDSQSMEKALGTLKTYLSSYVQMKQFKPAMLVFLHSLLARKEAKWYKPLNFVIFDWIADDWRKCNFPPKQAKRAAYAIYATYLHRDAPLSLQSNAQALDPELGLPRLELADSVRGLNELFSRQPTDAQVERIASRLKDLQDRLHPLGDALVRSIGQEVLAKRRDGFVSDILPAIDSLRDDLSEDKQYLFLTKSRPIMQAHLQFLAGASFGGDLEAGCLATVLDHVFQLRPPDAAVSDWPVAVLNCPRRSGGGRRLSATFEKRGPHLLRLVELDRLQACSACGRLLSGPGPQGYVCTVGDCEVTSHRSCIDKVKPINCSASKLSMLARSLSGSRESMTPASQKPPQPPPHAATSLENDLPATQQQQQQQQLRRQSQQSTMPQDISLPTEAPNTVSQDPEAATAAAAFGRQSRSPSLQPVVVNGEPATAAAASGNASLLSEPDLAKDDASQLNRMQPQAQPSSLPPPPPPPSDHVSGHPDIRSVQVDFHAYIDDMNLNGRLADLRKTYDKDFDRLKEYQLALHEIVFSTMSHLRALTLLQQLFVQDWPPACWEMLTQLGLHFVPDCITLYKSLLLCLRGPSLEEFRDQPCLLEQFGERLLGWYAEDDHVFEFKRLSLSFGFAKTATKRKTANINEDDIILKLISLRRDNPDFNAFFSRAESHPAMTKRRFVDLYSVNMQQTMRMATLLDAAVKKAKKAKSACIFAVKDAENLDLCLNIAKGISDYSNSIGVKLKELSRQLVLSKSFSTFWEKSMMSDSQVHRFKNQISHLHTCRLHLTREVHMPGLENYRLRLFVFTEFLLVISESDEGRTIKYQLLKHLGPSVSVASLQQQQQQPSQTQQQQQQQQQQNQQPPTSTQSQPAPPTPTTSDAAPGHASLIAVSCPPIIPMESVVHIFDTDTENRRKLDLISGGSSMRVRCAEFRIIIEQTLDNSGRVKPLMLEFRVGQDKPRAPFLANETGSPASEFADCIRKLAPRLSSRIDRHSSMAGSSTDLASRVSAVAAAGVGGGAAVSAMVSAAAAATVAAAQAASSAERHRRANSHAGLAVAVKPALFEPKQDQSELGDEQEKLAGGNLSTYQTVGGEADASLEAASADAAADDATSPALSTKEEQQQESQTPTQLFNSQRELLRKQGHSLMMQLMPGQLNIAIEAHTASWSSNAASLPPPTPIDSADISADTATLRRAVEAAKAKAAAAAARAATGTGWSGSGSGSGSGAEAGALPSNSIRPAYSGGLHAATSPGHNELSSSLTSASGSAEISSQTPPPGDFVVVERRAQITRRDPGCEEAMESDDEEEEEEDDDDDEDDGSGSDSSSSDSDSEEGGKAVTEYKVGQ